MIVVFSKAKSLDDKREQSISVSVGGGYLLPSKSKGTSWINLPWFSWLALFFYFIRFHKKKSKLFANRTAEMAQKKVYTLQKFLVKNPALNTLPCCV